METGPGHSWAFKNLKSLWGQGKLCCVLKGQYRDLIIGDEKELVDITDIDEERVVPSNSACAGINSIL